MAIEAFGADREDIKSTKFLKFKMETDQRERAGIIYFDDDPKTMFLGAKAHAQQGYKTFLCKSDKNHKEICCTHSWSGNNARYHIGCVIVVYQLDGSGKIKGYEVTPWVFWEKMYQKLVSAGKEFPLHKHDIKLACSNGGFQTIDVNSCKDSIWLSNEKFKQKILEEAKPHYDNLSRNLGADMSVTEIKEMLGIDTGGSDDAASEVDLGNVMDSLDS